MSSLGPSKQFSYLFRKLSRPPPILLELSIFYLHQHPWQDRAALTANFRFAAMNQGLTLWTIYSHSRGYTRLAKAGFIGLALTLQLDRDIVRSR